MKAWQQTNSRSLPVNPAMYSALRRRASRVLMAGLTASLAITLSGCFKSTHAVPKTVLAPNVQDATLEQLNSRLVAQYSLVKTINAKVTIKASTGGQHQGEVAEYPAFSGYMLLRKPSDLFVVLQLPLVGSTALEMVSDGKNFKLLIPPKNIAREGSEELTTQSPKGFENLRPNIIREALLVPPIGPGELVLKTEHSRLLPPPRGKKEQIEEPDYDLTISRVKQGNELQTLRVVHISRVTLKPYELEIYDAAGRVVTVVAYDKYQKFGDVDYPMSILITRPIDEYSLKIEIVKLTLNQEMDDEQFTLKFPEGTPVQKMP